MAETTCLTFGNLLYLYAVTRDSGVMKPSQGKMIKNATEATKYVIYLTLFRYSQGAFGTTTTPKRLFLCNTRIMVD